MHARLALSQRLRVDQVVRHALDVRHVHGDEVRRLEEVVQLGDARHAVARELERGIKAEHGVVADHLHAEAERGSDHLGADGAEADDTNGLALDLQASEHRLVRLDALGDLFVVAALLLVDDVIDVVVALDDATAGQEQAAYDELFDGVGVGAGGVKHGDATLGHLLDRDVVGASAAAHNAAHRGRDVLHLQLLRAEHNGHCRSRKGSVVAGHTVLALGVLVKSHGRDCVVRLDGEALAVVLTVGTPSGGGLCLL
mmetsp:Transcript_27202/g.68078  ORF Transcript_27202/g.68078 Transcript_27202/m.68078 type:complete len:255 (-) Transcript_27202:343-1107(-)